MPECIGFDDCTVPVSLGSLDRLLVELLQIQYQLFTKINDSCKRECLGEVMLVSDPFFLSGSIGFDDCVVYLLTFRLSTLYQL